MNLIAYAQQQLALFRKRRELKQARQFLFVLRDQVHSGQVSVRFWEAKERQIEAEILALEPPDDILRRAGA